MEMCKSAGAAPKRRARDNGDADGRGSQQGRRQSGNAPKVIEPPCNSADLCACRLLSWCLRIAGMLAATLF